MLTPSLPLYLPALLVRPGPPLPLPPPLVPLITSTSPVFAQENTQSTVSLPLLKKPRTDDTAVALVAQGAPSGPLDEAPATWLTQGPWRTFGGTLAPPPPPSPVRLEEDSDPDGWVTIGGLGLEHGTGIVQTFQGQQVWSVAGTRLTGASEGGHRQTTPSGLEAPPTVPPAGQAPSVESAAPPRLGVLNNCSEERQKGPRRAGPTYTHPSMRHDTGA